MPDDEQLSQSHKSKAFAREVKADEDETRWDERLAEVARHNVMLARERPE